MAISMTVPRVILIALAFIFVRHFVVNDIAELVVDGHRHDSSIIVSFADQSGSDFNAWNSRCTELTTRVSGDNALPHEVDAYQNDDDCKEMYGDENLYKNFMGDARVIKMPKRDFTPATPAGGQTPATTQHSCVLVCDSSKSIVYKPTPGNEGVPVHFEKAHQGSLVTAGMWLALLLAVSDIIFAARAIWRVSDGSYPYYQLTKIWFWIHLSVDICILITAFVCSILYQKWQIDHRPDEHAPKVLDALVKDVLSVNITMATFMTTRLAYYAVAVFADGGRGRMMGAKASPEEDVKSYPDMYRSTLRNRNTGV